MDGGTVMRVFVINSLMIGLSLTQATMELQVA